MANFNNAFNYGLIAGGMVDGTINVWNPALLAENVDDSLLLALEQHQGTVSSLDFNPHKESSHLLASGGSDTEVYVISLERPDAPSVFIPAPPPNNAKHTADITKVAWNSQVAHILASASQNGSTFVWDLRQKRAWCELRDPSGGVVSDLAWNPDQGLHILTASGDDRNPVLKLWDLRSSTSLPLATLQGHTEGVLSVSWCPSDTSYLLSCGKDNKTLLWDLYSLQPVYELPSTHAGAAQEQDNSSFGFASSASSRKFNVQWSPCLPAVVSTSSFDRKVQFFSLTGPRTKNARAPKWLRRPVGATFGFGGKLVTIDNIQVTPGQQGKKNGATGKLNVYQITENPELIVSSDNFSKSFSANQLKEYCEAKSNDPNLQSNQVWNLMKVICFGANAREELLTYLGFDSETIANLASTYLISKDEIAPPQDANDLFGGVTNPVNHELDIQSLTLDQKVRVGDYMKLLKENDIAENNVRKAIIVGNFDLAVECCLRAGLLAEALLLAQCGSAELRVKTQAAFFEKQRHIHPFLNVLHAVIKSQLLEFVMSSDLKNWKETLALLSTYGKKEEFAALCEALALRLEKEIMDKKSATLCYMCAANVQRTISFWTDELELANAHLGQLDTLALQDYVEKIMIFTKANPTEDLGPECSQYFAKYAELLVSQGNLSSASTYLKGNSLPVSILNDRIYQAGTKPAGSRAPAFPFNKTNVESTPVVSTTPAASVQATAQPVAVTAAQPVARTTQQQPVKQTNVHPALAAQAAHQAAQAQNFQQQQQPAQVIPPTPQPAAPTTSTLPPGWIQLFDPSSNLPYYVNQQTGVSQWEPPVPVPAPAPVPVAAPVQSWNPEPVQNTTPAAGPQQGFYPGQQEPAKPQPIPVPEPTPAPVVQAPVAENTAALEADYIVALGQLIEVVSGKS